MENVKSKKTVLKVLLVTAAVIAMTAQSAFAATQVRYFTKADVDSNTFNAVSGTTTAKTTTYTPWVNLEYIYKANGDDSNYQKVRFRINSGSTQASVESSTTIEKGTNISVPLTAAYSKVGTSLTLYAMGNDPALDCQITGDFQPS